MLDIRISEVLTLIEQGKTRKEIAEHYKISMLDCKKIFNNPKLKGKRAKKQQTFKLIDDTDKVTNAVDSALYKREEKDATILNHETLVYEEEVNEDEQVF